MSSRNSQHENYATKNREILNKLNSNDLTICNILNELSKKVDRLSSDLECVKSYINKLEDQKKLSRATNVKIQRSASRDEVREQQDKNISSGWFFSY